MDIDKVLAYLRESADERARFAQRVLMFSIPLQIRAMRHQREWTQEQLAEKAGLSQSQVSDLETPGEGLRHSVATYKAVAAAFDVALEVRFCSFSELLNWANTVERISPPGYETEFSEGA